MMEAEPGCACIAPAVVADMDSLDRAAAEALTGCLKDNGVRLLDAHLRTVQGTQGHLEEQETSRRLRTERQSKHLLAAHRERLQGPSRSQSWHIFEMTRNLLCLFRRPLR